MAEAKHGPHTQLERGIKLGMKLGLRLEQGLRRWDWAWTVPGDWAKTGHVVADRTSDGVGTGAGDVDVNGVGAGDGLEMELVIGLGMELSMGQELDLGHLMKYDWGNDLYVHLQHVIFNKIYIPFLRPVPSIVTPIQYSENSYLCIRLIFMYKQQPF